MNRYLRAWLIGLVVGALLLGRQVANFSSGSNRFYWTWDYTDSAILIGCMLFIASAGTGLYAIVRWINRPLLSRITGHLWIVLLVVGILSNVRSVVAFSPGKQLAWWSAMIAILIASISWKRSRLVEFTGNACLVFFLFPVILMAQILSWKSWAGPTPRAATPAARTDATPVFIFSFDGWDWLISSSRNRRQEFNSNLPNLRKLSQESYLFQGARSSAIHTVDSLPRMLYQIESPPAYPGMAQWKRSNDGEFYFSIDRQLVNSQGIPSIFSAARQAGYQTSLVTYYLPWRQILGDEGDYLNIYHEEPKSEDVLSRGAYMFVSSLRYYPYPFNNIAWDRLYASIYSRHWVDLNRQMQKEVLNVIETSPSNTIGFFHFPLPHWPFIFSPNGSYLGPYTGEKMRGTEAEYYRSLRYVDKVVGMIVAQLKKSHKYDNALLIFTADHGWATKRSLPRLLRVPLVIKIPGQTLPQRISPSVRNNQLMGFINLALEGRLDEASFKNELARLAPATTRPSSQPATLPN